MAALDTDLRRTDERHYRRVNPFWVQSSPFGYENTNEKVLLFAFPEVLGNYYLHQFVLEVEIAFSGGTPAIDIGKCTLDDPSVDLTYSNLDEDYYIDNTDVTEGSAGYYMPGTSLTEGTPNTVSGTVWAKALRENDVGALIVKGADTAMPAIVATLSNGLTAGRARLYMLVSRIGV